MKYLLYTLIYIIKDWDLSLEEFKPIGKILWWIPNFLHNVLVVLFKMLFSPIILLGIIIFEKNKKLILRFFTYWIESVNEMLNKLIRINESR